MWKSWALGYHLQTLGGVHVKWKKVKSVSCSVMSNSLRPHDCGLAGSSVHGILQQEFWRGLPCPSPGDLPGPGIEHGSPELGDGFFFFFFNWRLITLQYCSGFAIHWHESAMSLHVFPILNIPSHLPPHPIPLGHPSAPALSTLSHASNLDWQFISHMIIYVFQCYPLKSYHPRLLPESKSLFFTSVSILLSHI